MAAAPPCVDSPLASAAGLHSWERGLLRDCPVSALGDVRPFALSINSNAASSNVAYAHFFLGLKALHNFWYDLCKYSFSQAIVEEPDMYIAYAFRALCEAQLIWNTEDITASMGFLQGAQSRPGYPGGMDERERGYFGAVLALNGAPNPPVGAAIVTSRPDRYAAFLSNVTALAAAFPSDFTARSFVPLATLALGSVGECVRSPSATPCRTLHRAARVHAAAARLANPAFPGTLHYGMHAHDFAERSVYLGGLTYAQAYPQLVTSAVHSLHMPSHIFDRAGLWRNASAANLQSVASGGAFAVSGALAADGGPISEGRGLPFAFNAGNVYHSLEFGQYELLQACEYGRARGLLRQMRYATHQALIVLPAAYGDPIDRAAPSNAYAATLGGAIFNATTYFGWSERMGARQAMWAAFAALLGGVFVEGDPRGPSSDWRGLLISGIPLPSSWAGSDVYDHSFYAPQAEAGALAARAFVELAQLLLDGAPLAPPPPSTSSMCMHDDGCAASVRVSLALDVIGRAASHYDQVMQPHEAACVRALGLQISALAALTRNQTAHARDLIANASALDTVAASLLVPSSTTLCFLPSSALEGWLLLTHAGDAVAAVAAFEACLGPTSTPHNGMCALGLARARARLNQRREATTAYTEVIAQWHGNGSCGAAIDEAAAYVGDGRMAEVRIGYLGSDFYPDGSPCPWGRDMRLAAELAVHTTNLAGGFGGGTRGAIIVTHQLNGTTTTLDAALDAMEAAGVHAVIGADWSRVALAAAPRLAAIGVPLLPAGATSASLDTAPNVFRTSYSMSSAQPRLVQAAAQLGMIRAAGGVASGLNGANALPRIGLLASEDAFGLGGMQVLEAALSATGAPSPHIATFVSTSNVSGVKVGDGCDDHPERVAAVADAVRRVAVGADAVFVSATGPSTQCVFAAASSLGLRASSRALWLATEVIYPSSWTSDFGRAVADGARGYLSFAGKPYPSAAPMRDFRTEFTAAHAHVPDRWAGYAYDSVLAIASAVRASGPAPTGVALLTALRSVQLNGVTGSITFPPAGGHAPLDARIEILRLAPSLDFEQVGVSAPPAHQDTTPPPLHLYFAPFAERHSTGASSRATEWAVLIGAVAVGAGSGAAVVGAVVCLLRRRGRPNGALLNVIQMNKVAYTSEAC